MRTITALVLAAALTMTTACGALMSAIPIVSTAAQTAGEVLDAISDFLRGHGVQDAAVNEALVRARAALVVVLNAADDAKDVHDQELQKALDAFQSAYAALLIAVGPYGVRPAPQGGRLAAAGPGQLDVPDAPALRLSIEGQ
jgi:hypothetical protein